MSPPFGGGGADDDATCVAVSCARTRRKASGTAARELGRPVRDRCAACTRGAGAAKAQRGHADAGISAALASNGKLVVGQWRPSNIRGAERGMNIFAVVIYLSGFDLMRIMRTLRPRTEIWEIVLVPCKRLQPHIGGCEVTDSQGR